MKTIVSYLFGAVIISNLLIGVFTVHKESGRRRLTVTLGIIISVTLFTSMFLGVNEPDDCGTLCDLISNQFETSPSAPTPELSGPLGVMPDSLARFGSAVLFMDQERFEFIISEYGPAHTP